MDIMIKELKELTVKIAVLASKGSHSLFLFVGIAFLACALFAFPNVVYAGSNSETSPAAQEGATSAETAAKKGSDADDMERLAKESANPLGSLWMLWFQNDYSRMEGDLLPDDKWVNSFKFQPVMSFPIEVADSKWNLIVRPVLQYQSVPLKKEVGKLFGMSSGAIIADPDLSKIAKDPFGRTKGVGDTVLLTLIGPARLDGFVWGVGASQIFPSAAHDVLGQGKWQAGPAALLCRMAPKPGGFNLGALPQHWWSYAGDDDRNSTSMTNIQYFINYRLSETELIGMSPNIVINWKADAHNKLTLPVGLGYSNIVKIGPLPIRFAAEVQYSVVSPDNVGSEWNFRLMFIPVVPNPFAR